MDYRFRKTETLVVVVLVVRNSCCLIMRKLFLPSHFVRSKLCLFERVGMLFLKYFLLKNISK